MRCMYEPYEPVESLGSTIIHKQRQEENQRSPIAEVEDHQAIASVESRDDVIDVISGSIMHTLSVLILNIGATASVQA